MKPTPEIIAFLQSKQYEKAFTLLVKNHQEPIYWHIRRMVLNHDDADDITQNTFIKAWKNLPKFEGKSNVYTWLYRIATNETITFINKAKKHPTTSAESVATELKAQQSAGLFTGNEIEIKLQQAINTLPEKQKLVFNLKYFDDLKYSEISEITGNSEGALKASYHHAVKKIKEYLGESTWQ